MNTVTFTLTFLFIYLHVAMNAQDNLPAKFQDSSVKWTSMERNEERGFFDQRFHPRLPIIIQDTIYTFANYFQNGRPDLAGYSGYSIKKINKNTGHTYWTTSRFYNKGSRKAISTPIIKDGNIIVTLFDEAAHELTSWHRSYPAHIVLDSQTGVIIDSNYVNRNHPDIPIRFSDVKKMLSESPIDEPRIYYKDGNYLHRRYVYWPKQGLINTLIDANGYDIAIDTTFLELNNASVDSWNDFPQNETVLISSGNTYDRFHRELLITRINGDRSTTTKVDPALIQDTTEFMGTSAIDNGHFVFGTTLFFYKNEFYVDSCHIGIKMFDLEGNLKDQMKFALSYDTINFASPSFYPIMDTLNNRMMVINTYLQDVGKHSSLEIYVSDGEGKKVIKRAWVSGTKDYIYPEYATMLDNGDILMYVGQVDKSTAKEGDFLLSNWWYWVLLDGTKMDITTVSTDDVSISQHHQLSVFPNPTSSTLQIVTDADYDHVLIHSTDGKITKQVTVSDGTVNVTSLPDGTYVCTLMKGGNIISSGVKFVKVGK